jgi:ribonuclease J
MLKLIPLGGLGEIGLNMMAIEHGPYILVVDAGLMFPDDFLPGVDLVIPDFRFLQEAKDRVGAIILTHAHEDHIGAMPFFLREFNIPVYGTGFTLAILKEKLREHRLLERADLRKVTPGQSTELGPFTVEYIRVNHSTIEGVGLAIDTPEGLIVHSGDFRIDSTPVDGQPTDLNRFAHHGERGVLALLSDSTNAEKEGYTISEKEIRKTLADLFESAKGRVIVATFASNISRIQQVIELACQNGRKLLFNGKSMVANVSIAKEQGFIRIPEDAGITERQIEHCPDEEIAIVTTGSQGEPMSALSRMAQGRHKSIKVKAGDTIILSSKFIPGNEKAIASIINNLYRMGAEVVYEKVSEIHTSGHARGEELKLMLGLVRPRYFVPIHGEYRHLVKHARIALNMGIPGERVLLVENGTAIAFSDGEGRIAGQVPVGRVMVDGKGVGDVGELVLRDRRRLSGHGMVIVLLAVDEHTGESIYGPDIISRGFVLEAQHGFILEDAKCIVLEILDEIERPAAAPIDWTVLGGEIERRLKRFFYNVIERSPLVLATIIPV